MVANFDGPVRRPSLNWVGWGVFSQEMGETRIREAGTGDSRRTGGLEGADENDIRETRGEVSWIHLAVTDGERGCDMT